MASPAFARWIDRVCGMVFIGFGAKLALSRA
jgi:threonine/homoserine/homoserine lactone efflux protein